MSTEPSPSEDLRDTLIRFHAERGVKPSESAIEVELDSLLLCLTNAKHAGGSQLDAYTEWFIRASADIEQNQIVGEGSYAALDLN